MTRNHATVTKVAALAEQAGTAGEQQAAEAALTRLGRSVARTNPRRLTDAAIKAPDARRQAATGSSSTPSPPGLACGSPPVATGRSCSVTA